MPESKESIKEEENQQLEDKVPEENGDRFESDTQKIVHRHLEDEDDIITEEDIASVRIGMTPPEQDAATEARFNEKPREEAEEEFLEDKEDSAVNENPREHPTTPWDTVDPSI